MRVRGQPRLTRPPFQPVTGCSVSSQATQEAKIWRIAIPGQPEEKVLRDSHPSYHRKCAQSTRAGGMSLPSQHEALSSSCMHFKVTIYLEASEAGSF
jgi:hypothetical protein